VTLNYFNYFTEIEDTFIRRRGKHLLLSPLDWALIESWKQRGVPLHVALRGIEQAFDSFEARPRRRSVKSLLYCEEEVEAQFAEWRDRQQGAHAAAAGHGTEADAGVNGAAASAQTTDENAGLPFPRAVILAHLADCRTQLEQAHAVREQHSEAALSEALARAAARLAELESDFARSARPDAKQLEAALTDLESLLDRAVSAHLPTAQVGARRAQAEEQLRAYRTRMERATYEQTRDNLLAKLLREDCGVPRLSLFYL
jgi:DNA repair exonuclease SbcCD ATPase subunit